MLKPLFSNLFRFNISDNVTNFMENFCTNILLELNYFVVVRSKLWLMAYLKVLTSSDYFGEYKLNFLHMTDEDCIHLKYSLQSKGADYCTRSVLDFYFYSYSF
jgi:hypothetical protein